MAAIALMTLLHQGDEITFWSNLSCSPLTILVPETINVMNIFSHMLTTQCFDCNLYCPVRRDSYSPRIGIKVYFKMYFIMYFKMFSDLGSANNFFIYNLSVCTVMLFCGKCTATDMCCWRQTIQKYNNTPSIHTVVKRDPVPPLSSLGRTSYFTERANSHLDARVS